MSTPGPKLDEPQRLSAELVAATLMVCDQLAVMREPALPAAQKSWPPLMRTSRPADWVAGSVTPVKLTLTIWAPFSAAQRAPSISASIPAVPSELLVTRIGISEKFQPTPTTPRLLFPIAAAHPATKVPCPLTSSTRPPLTSARLVAELYPLTRAPARSGWSMSIPLSQTATMMSDDPVVKSQASAERSRVCCHELGKSGSFGKVKAG